MTTALRDHRYVGFPPGRGFLLLPASPRRATRAGLALYDGVEPRQRAALAAGRLLARCGGGRLLPSLDATGLDWQWWTAWLREVAEPLVGPVHHVAVRRPPSARVCLLLLDARGAPLGFAKLLDAPTPEFSAQVRARLTDLSAVRVPRTLAEGRFDCRCYVLFEPMPEGPHRAPPVDPDRVRAIAAELRERLHDLPRPADVPEHHVVCHTGFTPRNLRVTSTGEWWLYDWDYVTWGPPAAPELRYWCAEVSYRRRPEPAQAAREVHRLLRVAWSDEQVLEAATWRGMLQTYRALEKDVRDAVAALAASAEDGVRAGHR